MKAIKDISGMTLLNLEEKRKIGGVALMCNNIGNTGQICRSDKQCNNSNGEVCINNCCTA